MSVLVYIPDTCTPQSSHACDNEILRYIGPEQSPHSLEYSSEKAYEMEVLGCLHRALFSIGSYRIEHSQLTHILTRKSRKIQNTNKENIYTNINKCLTCIYYGTF